MKENDIHIYRERWRGELKKIQNGFPSPWNEAIANKSFEETLQEVLSRVYKMKHHRHFSGGSVLKPYLGIPDLPDYSQCKDQTMSNAITPHNELAIDLTDLLEGLPHWNHPLTMCNVNPPCSTPSIIAACLCNLFNPDIIEGEYSWNIAKAEIETGAMLAELVGWEPQTAGGVYTFGGTGAYLYALKLALATVFGKEVRKTGVREDGQLLVSETGHYAKETTADWSGLGTNNCCQIKVDAQHRMDISHLNEEMKRCNKEGKPVVMIVATVGTTDAFAIDPLQKIRKLIDGYENAKGYPKPLLYADSVIGWPWMSFKSYDFSTNPLEFSAQVLKIIKSNFRQIKDLHLVDAMGIDFHKTGWAPFNSSFFLVRNYQQFVNLLGRDLPPYLQHSTDYNPFYFTLETSRAASGALAGWASLKFFGYTGYRVMMGRIIEITQFFRQLLAKEPCMICVNPDNYGFSTLFRVYPKEVDAETQYAKEMNDPKYTEELKANNALQKMIANKLFDMLRDQEEQVLGWENPPYTSYTEAAQVTTYTTKKGNAPLLISALKTFPMSPFSNEISILLVRNYALKARDLIINELKSNPPGSSPEEAHVSKIKKWWGEEEKQILYRYLISLENKQKSKDISAAPVKKVKKVKASALHPAFFHKYSKSEQSIILDMPLFSPMSHSSFAELLEKSSAEILPSNTVIFSQDELADDFYVILEGRVLIVKQDPLKKEEHPEAILMKGDFFGEMAVFEHGRRGAGARTIEQCKLFKIKGSDFINLIS